VLDTPEAMREELYRALSELNGKASPGLPYMYVWRDVATAVEEAGDAIVEMALKRACALLSRTEASLAAMDGFELVRAGLKDPDRVFVKNELHNVKKIAEKRMRIIVSVSIVDQLVERLFASRQNDAEIASWDTIPSCPGMGHDDASVRVLISKVVRFERPVSSDVSGFDWSLPEWLLLMDAERRGELAGPMVKALARARMRCLARGLFVLSDGRAYTQRRPGVMKSGSYLTSSSNSAMRVMLARLTGAVGAMAMGDDCVEDREDTLEEMVERYARFGITITDASEATLGEGVEFCALSLRYRVEDSVFLKWEKSLANLLRRMPASATDAASKLDQLHFCMRHNPTSQWGIVERVIRHAGWGA
jgi:hypothetical protein